MMAAIWIIIAVMIAQSAIAQEPICPPNTHSYRPPESQLQLCWQVHGDNLQLQMSHPGRVWIALGLGAAMVDVDVVVGHAESGEVVDMFSDGYGLESAVMDRSQDISETSAIFSEGYTYVQFLRPLNTGDAADRVLTADGAPLPLVWAVGEASDLHHPQTSGSLAMDWSGHVANNLPLYIFLHAALMLIAWMVLIPLGVIIARFYKVTPGQDYPREVDNKFWWHSHLLLQNGGILLACIALYLVWTPEKNLNNMHAVAGMSAMALGLAQVISGFLRGSTGGPWDRKGRPQPPQKVRGDHYDMTLYRRLFEFVHKKGGYVALGTAYVAGWLGLRQIGAHWLFFAAYAVWLALFAVWFYLLQKSGGWIDTYQAIWGPDPVHPGNRQRLNITAASSETESKWAAAGKERKTK